MNPVDFLIVICLIEKTYRNLRTGINNTEFEFVKIGNICRLTYMRQTNKAFGWGRGSAHPPVFLETALVNFEYRGSDRNGNDGSKWSHVATRLELYFLYLIPMVCQKWENLRTGIHMTDIQSFWVGWGSAPSSCHLGNSSC